MPTIPTPALNIFQEFAATSAEPPNPPRACVVAVNAVPHRHSITAEKDGILVGAYDPNADADHPWPGRTAGSKVDPDSVKLFIDDALLLYLEDLMSDSHGGRGTVSAISGYRNRIHSSAVTFKSNGASYPRSGLLFDRDVRVDDVVYLRGIVDPEGDCIEYELWTSVAGFVAEVVAATVEDAESDVNNVATRIASHSIAQTGGPENCIEATVDASLYNGLASGNVCETYTISVVQSTVAGCQAARLRVVSGSGMDNQAEVTPSALGSPTAIGTSGLKVTFSVNGACDESSIADGIAHDSLVSGQVWTVEVCQAVTAVCATSAGDYTSTKNDTYIIEVTKGGTFDELPEITVSTVKGLDYSGPLEITGLATSFPVGTKGVTCEFVKCSGGDPTVHGLRKGDKFYIPVTAAGGGNIRTLILRHDLPTAMLDLADLDLRLYIKNTIEVTEDRLSAPPLVNYVIEDTQIVVKAGITAYNSGWTSGGNQLPLPVVSGSVYVEYSEWLVAGTVDTYSAQSVADLDAVPGPLDPANPLKWGMYHAVLPSAGVTVYGIAVADPTVLDSWRAAAATLEGRPDLYNLVPLSYDREVWNVIQGYVNAESAPTACNWKGMIVNLQAVTTLMVVGESTPNAQLLTPTSTDGSVVLAALDDNPEADGTQYTRLSVPAANSDFITYGVRAGDIVRYLYVIDAFGNESYTSFVVDSVLSENTLLLLAANDAAVTVPQRVEIWRNLTKDEIAANLAAQAQSIADRRVVCTWPDVVGTAGVSQPGYYLACAIAGQLSGIPTQQSLTNAVITGFDDLASRTTKFFSQTQLNVLQNAGIWICTETREGTPYTRNALTTDTSDVKHYQEMFRRNYDFVATTYGNAIKGFIGKANVTEQLLARLNLVINQVTKDLQSSTVDQLGPPLIDATIISIDRHPLYANRVVIVLNVTLPLSLDNEDMYLVA